MRPILILLALIGTGLHFAYSGVYSPLTNYSWAQLSQEQLPPLISFVNGHPIESIDRRQYGAVLFFVVHPILALTRGDLRVVELVLLAIGHLCVAASFVILWRSLFAGLATGALVLLVVWYNFEPIYGILATKNVELWELLLLTISFVAYVSPARRSAIAGAAAGLASMVKLLPLVVVGFFLLRDRRAFVAAIAAIGVILVVAQILYGDLMGFGYFPQIAQRSTATTENIFGWWENNAISGVVHKLLAGFRLEAYFVVLPPDLVGVARVLAWGLSGVFLGGLAWIALRGRRSSSVEIRAVEFSLVLVVMLFVSPNTHQDYMVLALPAYATGSWLRARSWPDAWPLWATATLVASVVLVGEILPTRLFVSLIPGLPRLAEVTGLDVGAAYLYYLFPALGLALLLATLMWTYRAGTRFERERVAPLEVSRSRALR